MHRLAPLVQELSKDFKLAYFTGCDPNANPFTNLASLFLITAPKVQIAIDNYNRHPLLKGVTQIKMPTLPIPKIAPSYFIILGVCAVVGATKVAWGNKRVSQCLDGIEKLADAVSCIAAIGLISTGQVAAGGVILFCLSIQVLQRMDYISADKSLGMSLLGNTAGFLVAPTHAQRAVKAALVASVLVGIWLCRQSPYNKTDCRADAQPHKHAKDLYFHFIIRNVIQGAWHPDTIRRREAYNNCRSNQRPQKPKTVESTNTSENTFIHPTLRAFREIRLEARRALNEGDHHRAFEKAKQAFHFFQRNDMTDKTELHQVHSILHKCLEYGVYDGTDTSKGTFTKVEEFLREK